MMVLIRRRNCGGFWPAQHVSNAGSRCAGISLYHYLL